MQKEVDELLAKSAIVPSTHRAGFHSNLLWFLSVLAFTTHTESEAIQSLHAYTCF